MTKKLFIQVMVKYLAGVILVGVLIFLPAGTFAFILVCALYFGVGIFIADFFDLPVHYCFADKR